jgi:hypothetical protein
VVHVEGGVAEAVHHQDVSDQRAVLRARLGQLDRFELGLVELVAGVGELRAARQMSGDRGEYVAAVEGGRDRLEPVRRAGHVHSLLDASAAEPGQAQQAVVGSHQEAAVGGAQRDSTPLGAHLRVDYRHVHADRHVGQRVAQHQRALADGVAAHAMGDVDDLGFGVDRQDHAVADPDEVVVAPVVGQQRDDHAAPTPRAAASAVSALTRPSMSCRSASTAGSRPCSRSVALVTGPIDATRAPAGTLPPPDRKKRTVEDEVKVT